MSITTALNTNTAACVGPYQTMHTGITNTGRTILSTLWAVLTVGLAGYNTYEAIHLADKQYDIAKLYYNIAKWWRDYYNTSFVPVENQELAEANALKEETPHYDMARGQVQNLMRIKFKGMADRSLQCTSEYCTGLRGVLLRDIAGQEATAVAAATGLGYRNERAYIEVRSDVRWQKIMQTIKRGRDMQSDAINSAKLAYGVYGDLLSQASTAATGAAEAFGYFMNRNDTIYPTLMRGNASGQQGTVAGTQQVSYQTDPQQTGPKYTSGVAVSGKPATAKDPGYGG